METSEATYIRAASLLWGEGRPNTFMFSQTDVWHNNSHSSGTCFAVEVLTPLQCYRGVKDLLISHQEACEYASLALKGRAIVESTHVGSSVL